METANLKSLILEDIDLPGMDFLENKNNSNLKEGTNFLPKRENLKEETNFLPKKEIQLSIERSIGKIHNLAKKTNEIQQKIDRLEEELMKINTSCENELRKLESYALKPIQTQGSYNPTEEQIKKNKNYNSQLQNYKKEVLFEVLPKDSPIFREDINDLF